MAAARAKQPAIGSTAWIQSEREQADLVVEQEAEEFCYAVRNELDWLNEHMAEVFSNTHVPFADVFKTPGKLRGKTPRTARKRDPLAPRQPLSDVFGAPNLPIPQSTQTSAALDKAAHFQIAEDSQDDTAPQRPANRSQSPKRTGKSGYTDSGYHGMTEDEMDIDFQHEGSLASVVPLRDDQQRPQPIRLDTAEAGGLSDDSFVSAKEGNSANNVDAVLEIHHESAPADTVEMRNHHNDAIAARTNGLRTESMEPESIDHDMVDAHLDDEASRSLSETSSPEKPLQRKSSFAFAALPAREPMTGQRSIGARISQIDRQNSRGSVFGKSVGNKSLGAALNDEEDRLQQKSEESKVHNKISTQSLHERIMMLGKTKEPRPSKSIPMSAITTQAVAGDVLADDGAVASNPAGKTIPTVDDSDDDWIAPTKPFQPRTLETMQETLEVREASPNRPVMHQKSVSTTQIPSPSRVEVIPDLRPQKAQSVYEMQSTTPAGSPMTKKFNEGPLSASKNRLYSVLKSAKSIFASSANASATAKLEAHNTSPSRSPRREISAESKVTATNDMPASGPHKEGPPSPPRPVSTFSLLSRSPSKKSTRSSIGSEKKREKDLKAQQKAADDLEKARQAESQKAAREQEQRVKASELKQQTTAQPDRPLTAESSRSNESDMAPAVPSKSMLPSGSLRAPSRLTKPSRDPGQAARPAPVSIRVASQLQRLGQSSTMSKSQHESSAPAPPPKGTVRSTAGQGSVRSSTAPSNSRVRALEAAARKKEADERAAQKKVEQKRELDRKRAAKAEEERRAEEERKAAEQQRVQEAKLAAQRHAEKLAAEAKRREQQRLEQQRQLEQQRLEHQRQLELQRADQQRQAEQQRRDEEAEKARAAHELAEAIKRERAQQAAAHPRGDVPGTLRQLVKATVSDASVSRPPIQPNPAKPAKRALPGDDDGMAQGSHAHATASIQRPGLPRGPPSYQQNDAKRRRTNEEELDEKHSVMAPPKRPSNMRKESTLAKFPHGYALAPPSTAHHPANMFKAAVAGQHQLPHGPKLMPGSHPSQMVQVSNARIPFAENANPPPMPPSYAQPTAPQYYGGENGHPSANKFKTPVRQMQAPKSAKSAKSSPLYPNGDSIALPEIATDSEDEESDEDEGTGFRAPSWVASPALRELLTQQQLVDPESVFGPIGELKMDEVFRNGKNQERLKRFRDRGSSAAWIESGDAVTSAEKRRDMQLRERVAREGGWRYDPAV